MADYIITAPDGRKFKISGNGTKEEALAHFQSQYQPQPDPGPNVTQADLMGQGAKTKARTDYEALPWYGKPLVAANDLFSLFASNASFGLADKAAAAARSAMLGTNYADERAKIDQSLQDARDRAGGAGTVAEIGGMVATPVKAAGAGLTATRLPKMGGLLGLGVDSAAMGAADAYGHDQNVGQGALAGGLLGLAGGALVKGASKVISPLLADAATTKAANILKNEGVSLTAGQKTGSKSMRYAESELGGGKAGDVMDAQKKQFTAAVLKRVGENADEASPEVLDRAFTRIGKTFDQLASRNSIIPDQKIAQDLTQIAVDYSGQVGPGSRAPIIERAINNAMSVLQTGRMDGKVYQTLRTELGAFARKTMQPEAKFAAYDIISALDDAMSRNISPRDAGLWQEARNQYRNMLVVEQAATGAGENAAKGAISPSALRNATVTKHGRRNYGRGKGDFADLARAGEAVMKELPQSGTSPRMAARMVPNLLGAAVGGGIGLGQGDVQNALTYAATGAAIPYAVGRALMSKPVQAYIGNQAASKIPPEVMQLLARSIPSIGLLGYQGQP